MMVDVDCEQSVEIAECLRDALVREGRAIESLVSDLGDFIERRKISAIPSVVPPAPSVGEAVHPEAKLPTTIIEKVIDILKARGPLRTHDILDAMTAQGYKVNGKRPIQTLYSCLDKAAKSKRTRRVRRNRGGCWCLS